MLWIEYLLFDKKVFIWLVFSFIFLANLKFTGDITVKGLSSAALAAVLPPILRYLNPKDSLGRG